MQPSNRSDKFAGRRPKENPDEDKTVSTSVTKTASVPVPKPLPTSGGPATKPPPGMNLAKLDWLDANAGKSGANSNRREAYIERLQARVKKNKRPVKPAI
jgi:hypothetical protein